MGRWLMLVVAGRLPVRRWPMQLHLAGGNINGQQNECLHVGRSFASIFISSGQFVFLARCIKGRLQKWGLNNCRQMFAGQKLVIIYFHKVPHLGPKNFQVTGLLRLHPSSGKPPDESRFGEFVEQFRVFFFAFYGDYLILCICVSIYCINGNNDSPISSVPF